MADSGSNFVLSLSVRLTPGSKVESWKITGINTIQIKLRAKPIDGAANEALVNFLSSLFQTAKSNVMIRTGFKSRNKVVEVITEETVAKTVLDSNFKKNI